MPPEAIPQESYEGKAPLHDLTEQDIDAALDIEAKPESGTEQKETPKRPSAAEIFKKKAEEIKWLREEDAAQTATVVRDLRQRISGKDRVAIPADALKEFRKSLETKKEEPPSEAA